MARPSWSIIFVNVIKLSKRRIIRWFVGFNSAFPMSFQVEGIQSDSISLRKCQKLESCIQILKKKRTLETDQHIMVHITLKNYGVVTYQAVFQTYFSSVSDQCDYPILLLSFPLGLSNQNLESYPLDLRCCTHKIFSAIKNLHFKESIHSCK